MSKPTTVVAPDSSWLAGWWSVGGFCEGDAGETFLDNGEWGKWGVEGTWETTENNLKVTQVTRVLDTVSGDPEPIIPVEIKQGPMSNISDDAFTWMGDKMVRCPEG